MRRLAFLLTLLLGVAGCHKREDRTEFQHPQTVCIGRLRVTGPGPGMLVLFDSARLNGVKMELDPLGEDQTTASAWQSALADLGGHHYPYKVAEDTDSRKIVISNPDKSSDTYEVIAWQPVGRSIFKASAYAYPDRVSKVRRDVEDLLSGFSQADEVTSSQGMFCVAGGSIKMALNPVEQVRGHIRVPFSAGEPEQWFDVTTFAVNKTAEDDVVARHDEAQAAMLAHGMITHTLRKGKRSVAGMAGHEAIIWANSDHPGTYSFRAEFEFGGVANDSAQPNTSIIFADTRFPTSIKPEHLLALWDAVLDGVRMDR